MQVAEDVRRQREDAGGAPTDAETAKVARSAAVREFVDTVWPALTAPALLARLYAEPAFLERCSARELTDSERALLHRPAAKSLRATKWTAADAVLLDELTGLLEAGTGYVHAVVDEAQDLSPMQCRAIARRCPLGSVTVLGDLAQATTPWAPGDWTLTLRHLGHGGGPPGSKGVAAGGGAVIRPLTAGYRVPGEVLDVANRLLPHIARDVPPATSIRAGEGALRYARTEGLVEAVRGCLAEDGSVGVIVPDARAGAVLATLRTAGIDAQPLASDLDARATVVPASDAKGLEYDSVVLLEPAQIVAAEPDRTSGLRRLYVVLTRAVSRLIVLHDEPLPAELADAELVEA
jgi:superfamily I DNA/RNA helicase